MPLSFQVGRADLFGDCMLNCTIGKLLWTYQSEKPSIISRSNKKVQYYRVENIYSITTPHTPLQHASFRYIVIFHQITFCNAFQFFLF